MQWKSQDRLVPWWQEHETMTSYMEKGKGPEPETFITLRDHQSNSTSLPKSFVIFTAIGPQTIPHQYTETQIQQLVRDISDICIFFFDCRFMIFIFLLIILFLNYVPHEKKIFKTLSHVTQSIFNSSFYNKETRNENA